MLGRFPVTGLPTPTVGRLDGGVLPGRVLGRFVLGRDVDGRLTLGREVEGRLTLGRDTEGREVDPGRESEELGREVGRDTEGRVLGFADREGVGRGRALLECPMDGRATLRDAPFPPFPVFAQSGSTVHTSTSRMVRILTTR